MTRLKRIGRLGGSGPLWGRLGMIGLLLLMGPRCGPASPSHPGRDGGVWPGQDSRPANVCASHPGETVCDGNAMVECNQDGVEVNRQDCGTTFCVVGMGCVLCHAGETKCQGDNVIRCKDDYMGWDQVETCNPDEGQVCDPEKGSCVSLCDQAAERHANVGCEYVAVDMANVDEFSANDACFVVIVSNVQPRGNAVVTVEDAQGNLLDFPGYGTQRTIPPGGLEIFSITGAQGACSVPPAIQNSNGLQSGVMPGTVFVIRSSLPVVAYQINPYEAANRHTTDASLLIPMPALGTQYYSVNYYGLNRNQATYPSEISIVALQDGTQVTVNPTVPLQAGGPVPNSGSFDVTLNAFEHLQVLSQGYGDLTGTLVTASAPVALFSGDTCSDVPMGMGYCDHLEEEIPPITSWGFTYVAAFPPRRRAEKTVWRILAAVDNTRVVFEPSVAQDQTLSQGQMIEVETDRSFLVTASDASPDQGDPPPILVTNFLNGAEQTAAESGTDIDQLGNLRGDPAMTLSVPVEQYLNSYVFLSDPSYAYNYVVVVRTKPGQVVHLDCLDPIPEDKFQPVALDYSRAEIVLSSEAGQADGTCTSGAHKIWSDDPFGIWVYGYYADTSYGYPGGMNLEQINEVVVVE